MELVLTPELEQRVSRERELGHYPTEADVVRAALDALEARRTAVQSFREELNQKLDESFAAAERGEFIEGDELEAELDKWDAEISRAA